MVLSSSSFFYFLNTINNDGLCVQLLFNWFHSFVIVDHSYSFYYEHNTCMYIPSFCHYRLSLFGLALGTQALLEGQVIVFWCTLPAISV